ncbi:MAG: CaiB/BaiF CoA transferase family protein [Chloroflexota bacterium]
MAGALDGVRVLDLGRFVAGPHCAMLLGDLGADVVKVERPTGDDSRSMPPQINGESLAFMVGNRNKRGITLNFRHPRAQEILRALACEADVLVENFLPGTMEKMGCGWDTLHELNPRLIMVRISGFGQSGPYSQRPCFDTIAWAMSGLMDLTGEPDGPPLRTGTLVVDCSTGLYATIGILAALRARDRTGRGQLMDLALFESAMSFLLTAIPDYVLFGELSARMGNRDRHSAPSTAFKAGDGAWVMLGVGNDSQFIRLVDAMQMQHLLEDARFNSHDARLENVVELEHVVGEWVAGRTADEVVRVLEEVGVPGAKVATVADLIENPQVKYRGQIAELDHPKAGRIPMQGNIMKLSETPGTIRRPPPSLGEHNGEVLAEWLGYSPQQVENLQAEGVL